MTTPYRDPEDGRDLAWWLVALAVLACIAGVILVGALVAGAL